MWSPWKALWKKQDLQTQFREEETEWGPVLNSHCFKSESKAFSVGLKSASSFSEKLTQPKLPTESRAWPQQNNL